MSDIWIKKSNTNPKWAKALSIKIKRFSSTWAAAKVIWIKNSGVGWLRVWPTSGVFNLTSPFITTTASGSTPLYGNNSVIRIGTTYYGRIGTWDPNGFAISSYNYLWPYYSTGVQQDSYDELSNLGSGVFASPSNALTISTAGNATASDGKFISFRVTANASNVLYSNTVDSKEEYGKIKIVRKTPVNTTFVINGTASVGSTLSVSSTWNTTEAYKPDAARSTIYWYKSSSNTSIYNGQGRTQITSANGSYSYVVQQADIGSYIIAEETAFNTGSDYDIGVGLFTNGLNQVTAVSAIVAAASVAPTGGSASISGASTVGSLLTLTKTDATGSPTPTPTWLWRIADGGFGGNTFAGGTIVQNGGLTYTSQYSGYDVRVEITWSNSVAPAQSVITNTISVTAAATGPSGGSVTLSPSGTQQAGTTITANVSAMSGTATISYFTTIRKKTGSSPTSNTDGTEVASGTGTGNVASHTITTVEASGTPDQFRAFTTGTNSVSSNTVSSNTVISTPAVVVVAPAITSGPSISWASGNNFTLSATASNATNLEFQVQFANNNGGPTLFTDTFFFGASSGGGTTGSQSYSWARTRVRANNSSTGLSSSFSGYTGWA